VVGKRTVRDRTPVDRDRIVTTAMDIINEVGVNKLTMRAVAGRLDVSAMALYYHVEDKDELLRMVGDDVLGRLELPDPDSGNWRELLMSVFMAGVDVLLEFPGLRSVLLTSKLGPNGRRLVQFCIHQFERAGLDRETAQEVFAGVQTLGLGRLLIAESANAKLSASPHPDAEIRGYTAKLRSREVFSRALEALVDSSTSP
jgi:AcrR family transcriptional regulator